MAWFTILLLVAYVLLIALIIVEFVLYHHDKRLGTWNVLPPTPYRFLKGSLVVGPLLALALLICSAPFYRHEFSNAKAFKPLLEDNGSWNDCTWNNGSWVDGAWVNGTLSRPLNGDITGAGIRYTFIIQVVVLCVAMFLGFFKKRDAAVKELATSICICLFPLAVNLFINHKTINPVERFVVCLQIDGLIAALSMTYSDKEMLAARVLVRVSIALQCGAFIAIALAMSGIGAEAASFDLGIFWGVRFDSPSRAPWRFWIYFAFRILNELHNMWLALSWTGLFNLMEHYRSDDIDEEMKQRSGRPKEKAPDLNLGMSQLVLHDLYTSLASTVFTKCLVNVAFAIIPFIAIESLIAQCRGTAGAYEWGQLVAMLAVAASTAHWIYRQYKHARVSGWKGTMNPRAWKQTVSSVDCLRRDAHMKRNYARLLRDFAHRERQKFLQAIAIADASLELSIKRGDVQGAHDAIRSGAQLDCRYGDGDTPLIRSLAGRRGKLADRRGEIVKALLSQRRGENGATSIYSIPMIVLATKVQLQSVDLASHASVNQPALNASQVRTPILTAMESEDVAMLKILLDCSEDTESDTTQKQDVTASEVIGQQNVELFGTFGSALSYEKTKSGDLQKVIRLAREMPQRDLLAGMRRLRALQRTLGDKRYDEQLRAR